MSTDVARAVALLREGRLVAFPTETVYGLGADAENVAAIERLYAVKQRPADHPVIVHLASVDAVDDWAAEVPDAARALAVACWPGPLTLVLARSARVPDAVTGGRDTVGLRVPAQPLALELLRAFDGGLAAPSANRFGRVSPTTADDVRADLGDDVDLVLDGGPCVVGVESTIVDCSGPRPTILRLGGISAERITAIVGERPDVRTDGSIAAPGALASHYAPRARVLVVEREAIATSAAGLLDAGETVGLLALDPPADLPERVVVLEAPSDVDEYARVLYTRLRDADRRGLDVLLAVAPPSEGVGAAVADRLARAGGPR